jgi:outer membrane protein assembly factor BamA
MEIGHDNLFGTAQSASVREKLAEDGDRTDLTYRTPWLFGIPLKGDTTLFREHGRTGYNGRAASRPVLQEFFREPLTDISRMRVGLR